MTTNLVTIAQAHPDKVAIKLDDAELTYAQLHGLAAKAASTLRAAGTKPGSTDGDDGGRLIWIGEV